MNKYTESLMMKSEQRDFNQMHVVEWVRQASGKSAAATYMEMWEDLEDTRRQFEETGFNGLFLHILKK